MDEGTAQKYHFHVGDRVRILLVRAPADLHHLRPRAVRHRQQPGRRHHRRLRPAHGAAAVQPSRAASTPSTSWPRPAPTRPTVQHAIARVLPPGVEVVTGQTVANEQTSNINQALGFFSTALLVFAFISLFVGGVHHLQHVLDHRRPADPRAGPAADRRGEPTTGVPLRPDRGRHHRDWSSSLIGLGLGVLAAVGLEALLKGFGITLPSGSLVFEARTVIVALVVGLGVTVVSAISPARRAVRIPPVAAITDYQARAGRVVAPTDRHRHASSPSSASPACWRSVSPSRPSSWSGSAPSPSSSGSACWPRSWPGPWRASSGDPWPALFGISGKLGRENSMRSPRRTAQTASALMVGLALVSTITVFGASLSKSATSSVDNAVSADYIMTSTGNGARRVQQLGGHRRRPGARGGDGLDRLQRGVRVPGIGVGPDRGLGRQAVATRSSCAWTRAPGAGALAAGQLLIDTTTANSNHLVGGVDRAGQVRPDRELHHADRRDLQAQRPARQLPRRRRLLPVPLPRPAARRRPAQHDQRGARHHATAVNGGLSAYPNLKIQTRAQFEKAQQAQVNQLLGLVYALLALAVIIALIGIVNTLMLSVFERTHEIGLLRAVGMKRRQVRAMIRSESVILSLFGAIIGVIVGTALGTAFAASLKQQGITDIVVPFSSLVVFLVIAALLGLGAASWPARRAAKLDVLAAIAAD